MRKVLTLLYCTTRYVTSLTSKGGTLQVILRAKYSVLFKSHFTRPTVGTRERSRIVYAAMQQLHKLRVESFLWNGGSDVIHHVLADGIAWCCINDAFGQSLATSQWLELYRKWPLLVHEFFQVLYTRQYDRNWITQRSCVTGLYGTWELSSRTLNPKFELFRMIFFPL